ncbi:MAG: hypothetical protein IJT80_06545 [Lachnospiraceae bacterium]|nr:hypothetical protein [Lachnospiraceae bacterium]
MRKIWLKDALRNIGKRIVSWLSIVTIVFIGTTLILGLYFGSATVTKAGNAYITGQNFKDFDISSNIGIKEDEIERVKNLEHINDAEGQISVAGIATKGENSTGITLISITDRISVPTVTQGALPSAPDECAVSYSALGKLGAKTGDEIEINISATRFEGILSNNRFRITGVASHPDYMVNIDTDYIVIPLSCFDTSGLSFDYSNILVDADITGNTFKSAYKSLSGKIKEVLESEADSMLEVRSVSLNEELDKEYENAEHRVDEELEKGKSELDEATAQYNDTLADAKKQIEDGEKKLNELRAQGEEELAEAERKIEEGEKEYNTLSEDGEKQLADAKKQMEEELAKAKEELAEGYKELEQGEKTLNEKEAEYSEGERKLAQGKEELDKGLELYESALSQINGKVNALRIDQMIGILKKISSTLSQTRDMIDPADTEIIEITEALPENKDIEVLSGDIEVERKTWDDLTIESGEDPVDDVTKDDTPELLNDELITDELTEPDDDIILSDPISSKIEELIYRLENCKGKDTVSRCYAVLDIYDELTRTINREKLKEFEDVVRISDFRTLLAKIEDGEKQLEDYRNKYELGKEQLNEARKKLDEGWSTYKEGKKQLEDAQAEFDSKEAEAQKQLEDARKEFEEKKADGARKLADARAQLEEKTKEGEATLKELEDELKKAKDEYAAGKADGKNKLADANRKYEDAKKESGEKLSELKTQLDEVRNSPLNSIVQTRDVNFPYVQTKSFISSLEGFFGAFTPLYASIIAIVCFFTMTIIIEEQKAQIGTCKAFGMYESEIMRKYLVFGVSAALIGALTGIGGAFVIERFLINTMKNNLAFPLDNTGHNIFMIILLPSLEVMITVIAVLWSCHRYIRCSAVGLISGNEPVARYRKKAGRSLSKSIYLNLIINNLFTDIGREIVSVVTIVMCVFLVGFGIDIKLAYEGALARQMHNIWQFDLTLTESGTITDEEKEVIKQELAPYDTLYLPITAGVISEGGSQVLTSMICVDDKDEFGRFYVLKDPKGKEINVFDDGVLVTREMEDKNSLSVGSTVSLVSGELTYSEVSVKGIFMLYAGKTMIMTKDYYMKQLGTAPVYNTYYIKINGTGADAAALRNRLAELPGVSSAELTSNLRDRNLAVVSVYNSVVVIVILFSIMLSFMILLNLSNILVAHRMRELLTMRVNGFYNSQVIGYLAREVILTGLLAIVTALAVGMPVTGIIIKNIETDAFMFVRRPFILAWTASVMINVLFSVIINFIAFRKVNKVPLTDINKY